MKRFVLFALIVAAFSVAGAQCVIDTTISQPGFYPDTGTYLRPSCIGSSYDAVVQIYVPQSVTIQFGTFPVNYVRLDSVPDLPAGLHYSTNPDSGILQGGQRGCIDIYGVCTAPPGDYRFTIYYVSNFTVFGTPTDFPFTAPYRIHIDSGTATAYQFYDTTCTHPGYNFAGKFLNTTGDYNDTIPNSSGCDSIITLHLYVWPFSIGISATGSVYTAPAGYDSYQWIYCSDSTSIVGANSNVYDAAIPGSYAVQMSYHGCNATSTCLSDVGNAISNLSNGSNITFYPNPAESAIAFSGIEGKTPIKVFDLQGREVLTAVPGHEDGQVDISSLQPGFYTIMLVTETGIVNLPLVKKGNF